MIDLTQALMKGDADAVIVAISRGMERIEAIYSEYMNNAVVSAIVNAVNRVYLRSLQNLQNFTSAILHAMGMVSRKDVIALSEAYVDLKGDIKKESRKIREELKLLREELGKIRGGSNVV
jgi:N-methylhydantoinase B/oxoprolinase/acetone carboxylase alpha subunit